MSCRTKSFVTLNKLLILQAAPKPSFGLHMSDGTCTARELRAHRELDLFSQCAMVLSVRKEQAGRHKNENIENHYDRKKKHFVKVFSYLLKQTV